MNFMKKFKVLAILSIILTVIVGSLIGIYLWVIPYAVNSDKVQAIIDKKMFEYVGVNIVFENVRLKTGFPYISFSADNFELVKDKDIILSLKKTDSKFDISRLIAKKVIVKKLGADYIFVDVNKVLDIIPQQEKKEEIKSEWYFDFMESVLYINKLRILYKVNGIDFSVKTDNLKIDNTKKDKQPVKFDFSAIMKQGKNVVKVELSDNDKIYIKKKKLYIDETIITFNKSKLHLKGEIKDNKKFGINVFADNFSISNIVALIESNLVIPNGAEMLTYFSDIKGNFDFGFNITPKGIDGKIKLNQLCFILIPIENVPVHIFKGNILVDRKNINLKDFSGYYGTRNMNTVKFEGIVKDYMKTFETKITADGIVADDFAKYYLSPVIGIPLNIVGKADTRVIIHYLNNVINLKWLFKISPDDNLLVSGEPISKYKEERVVVSDMEIKGTKLKIKDLGYFVTVPGVKEFYRRKLISLHGLIDFAKGVDFRVMGFKIEKPVPSQFLNIIARQELFKNGTAVGELTAVDGPKGVKLFGALTLEKIIIPSQKLYVKSANISTDFNTIKLKAEGGYRRSHYSANGIIVNNLAFPLVINDLDFSLDSMDIAKLLDSFNQGAVAAKDYKDTNIEDNDGAATFDITNLIIKNCKLKLGKGTYNDLAAENMEATLTLDEKGDLDLDSNRFEFAGGHSSVHFCADIKNHKYHAKLGVKDVDSNIIATSLLNLPKEISGKSSGIMDLYTDETMKLNGNIKFIIKKGAIGKIGLIQYVLNVASVFRNPIVMINPMTVFDLINVPEGEFDKITGTLDIKNNIVDSLKIKSFSPYLSAYVVGSYNLEKKDAALKIYTKMTNKKKGVYGFLRNISLGNIASRVSIGARNDAKYYSAEMAELPDIEANDKDCQIFLTTVDGDIESFNFLSSLKKIR